MSRGGAWRPARRTCRRSSTVMLADIEERPDAGLAERRHNGRLVSERWQRLGVSITSVGNTFDRYQRIQAGVIRAIDFAHSTPADQRHDTVPETVPVSPQNRASGADSSPSRSNEEVIETRGFARKNGDGRNADRRLANRRLQPLGHLTAREN